ncbi:MAG: hypothetical protein DRQ40_04450 [Gammaproteobacteria bacterium]|nr:MAG: hypothetical protein DRQ40_04450 [Gammaproteobacteria bacterium]
MTDAEQEDSGQTDPTTQMDHKDSQTAPLVMSANVPGVPTILIRRECPPWVRKVVALRKEYQEDTDLMCIQRVLTNHTGLVWSVVTFSGSKSISVEATESDDNIVFAFDEESGHLIEVSVEAE